MTITGSGTGPGDITPDGSPVEYYAVLGPDREPEIISEVVPVAGTILELGSGTGRVTHPLVELGFEVVAVDESAAMLAHVRGARTVCAPVQELFLDRRFDAVLLASYLVNTPDDGLRQDFLSACARHVKADGSVLIQWQPAETHDAWAPGVSGRAGITMAAVEEVSPGLFAATMRYEHGDRVWTQSFRSRRMTDDVLEDELAQAGLSFDRFLTADHTWLRAVPQ